GQGHTWHENQLIPITRHGTRDDVYWTDSYGPADDPQAPNGTGGVLEVCTETTEQVLAERRMKAAEARWRALFDQASGFMCLLRGDEHTCEVADAGYYVSVGRRALRGKTVAELLPAVESQGFVTLLAELHSTGRAHRRVSMPLTIDTVGSRDLQEDFHDFVYH